MPKRGAKLSSPFAATMLLAAAAVALFAVGEVVIMTRTDSGRLMAARYFHVGDPADITRIVGLHIRQALDGLGVPRDSVRETVLDSGTPRVHWRVGLKPRASTLQANYAITRALETQGAMVLSGREAPGDQGELLVTLIAGLPGKPTHQIVLVRPGHGSESQGVAQAHLALVLYGLGEDLAHVSAVLARSQPFAAAIPAGEPWSAAAFRAARDRQRETVVHLPLEPLNYPQVNPGPGAILVTMGASKIQGTVRKYLDQAGPVSAVANLAGSLATQDQAVMTAVYHVLHERRTPFLHMQSAAGAVCRPLASELGVVYEQADLVIDNGARRDTRTLDRQWKQALDLARRRGRAIVMLRATDTALAWLPAALTSKRLAGVEIVPLASLLQRQPEL